MEVPIELIHPSPYQPRLNFNIDDLREEIERDGLLSAIVVRKHDDHYELLDGERRLRTLKELGWKMVPVDVREVDDRAARRSVFKLNKIRENYTIEEEARYYKKLADEDMTAWEISEELGVNFHWVLANLNVFKLPQDMQALIFTAGQQLTVSHIQELERTFGRSTEEAIESIRVILERHLKVSETRELAQERDREAEERARQARLDAAKKALPKITPEATKLETPEDYEKASVALREEARRRAEALLTPEERTAREADTQAQAEARKRRAEEQQRRKEEEKRRLEEEARKKATQELFENPALLRQAAERLADLKRREREARLKAQQVPLPTHLTEADLIHKVVIGDANEVLQLLHPSSVDLVVTSPPYFGLKDYEHNLGVNIESLNEYLDDLNKVFQGCYRTLKDGTFLCIVVGQYTSADNSYFIPGQVVGLLEDLGFRYKREHIWVKPLGVQGIWNRGTTSFLFEPFPRNTMINIHHEHILIFQKGERSVVFSGQSPLTEEEVKQFCWSIWELPVSGIKGHPAPFPEAIPERLIKMYSYEGEVVLDPFLGAGTTMKVAKALKRRSIGIEVSPEYLNLIQTTIGGADVIRFDEGKLPDFSYLAIPKT